MKYPYICFLTSLCVSTSMAGLQSDLQGFFNGLGGSANISGSGVYKDQSAGFYTGGQIFARNTVRNEQLMGIKLPSFRAGCGGIDMHMGSFSFISGEGLKNALKSVASNGASYGMLLALETMSPQVKNIVTELNDLAQRINQMNINSCEIAATTLGSVLPKSDAGNKHLCTMIGSDRNYGMFTDYASAKQGCGSGGKRDEVLEKGKQSEEFKKIMGTEFNLAWSAIKENALIYQDKELAEFFMSISGTITSHKTPEGDYRIVTHPSLANKNDILAALLHGGEATIYKCQGDIDKCLVVEKTRITIDPSKGFVAKVRALLGSMQEKIYSDSGTLTEEERAFLNNTRLPFYKIINVSTAFKKGSSPLDLNEYAEIGAVDVLYQYMTDAIDTVQSGINHLKSAQVDDTNFSVFQKSLITAKRLVSESRTGSFKKIEQALSMIKKTELLEKTIASKIDLMSTEGF